MRYTTLMKTGKVIAVVSVFVMIVALVTLIIVRDDPYFSKNRHVNVQKTEKLTAVSCEDAQNMTPDECENFLSLWKSIHREQLRLTGSQFKNKVTPVKIWKIDARYNLFRIDYQVSYGNIIINAHDQFPLSISADIEPPIPSLMIPRDNSPLTTDSIIAIGKARAWNSTVTFFEVKDLELPGYGDIEAFAADHLISSDVNYLDARLSFSNQGNPQAELRGTNKDGSRCYSGYISLVDSEYSLTYSGPCRTY